MNKTSRLVGAMALATALVAAACGDDDSTATPVETSAPAQTTTTEGADETTTTAPEASEGECTAERQGGSITIATPAYAAGLDPAQTTGAAATTGGVEMTALYDTLMRWNGEEGAFEPQLAESLEPDDDADVWTLTLRPDVLFANGDVMDAEAVVASIERLRGARVVIASFMEQFESIEVVDDLTVRFTLVAPWGDFPFFLADAGGMIVNAAVAETMAPEQFNLDPSGAGAGPYELVNFAPGEEVVLQARDDYWGGPVCIEEVRVISAGGDQPNFDALELGEVDLAILTSDPRVQAQAKEDYDGGGAIAQASQLMINARPGQPGADVNLRRALAAAVDIELIKERVYDGTGVFASTIAAPGTPLHTPGLEGPTFDPDLARSLVEQVKATGWDGDLSMIFGQNAQEEALLIEGMLRDVGINPVVELLPTPDLVARVINEKNFQVTTWSLNIEDASPWARLDTNLRSDSAVNRSGFGDPRADQALLNLRAAGDREAKAAAIAELQEVWNDQIPGILTRHGEEWNAWADHVHGVKLTRKSVPMLDDAWVEQ